MSTAPIALLKQIGKSYHLGTVKVTAVSDINLTIAADSLTFIAGPSGSGKTTLLNLLGALDRPSAGTIELLGTPLDSLSDNQLSDLRNASIGTIFQSFNLIEVFSAVENVEYPLILRKVARKERRARAMAMLAAVGLAERASHRPNQLSGGQRQRVAIARALVKNPALVLADEPTANLDSRTSGEIIALIREVQHNVHTAFVLCTHDPEILNHAELIIHMRDGRIVDEERLFSPAQPPVM
ncbi:MAG: ABC transporter ATP-binding protein [Desulfopila sp.]